MRLCSNDFRPSVEIVALTGILVLVHAGALAALDSRVRQDAGSAQSQLSPIDAVRQATVYIEASYPTGDLTGSGFVVSSDGIIATSAHVVAGATEVKVRLQSGEEYALEGILSVDEVRDIVLLRITASDLPTVSLGDSDSTRVGQRLLAFGAPLGLEATVADGLLSGIRVEEGVRWFQISTPVSPGSSGGPVTTEDGRVIGIVVAGIPLFLAQNLNFAVPVNYLRGHISIAAERSPTPLDEWRWQADRIAASALPGGAVPSVVNEGLVVDWSVLDGAGLYEEDRFDDGVRVERTLRFQTGTHEDGSAAIVMEMTELFRRTGSFFRERQGADFYNTITRSTIVMEDHHYFTTSVERIPLQQGVSPYSHTFTVDGDQFTFDTLDVTVASTRLPPGIIPAEHVRTLIAALPDPLPETLDLWVVDQSGQPSMVLIEFGAIEEDEIRVPRDDTVCTKDARTDEIRTNLRSVTYTLGSVATKMRVADTAPHLGFREDSRCLVRPDWFPVARR